MFNRKFSGLEVVGLLAICLTAVATLVHAVSVPNIFTAGTTARASEVNANFTALTNAITTLESQNLNSRITALESALSALESQVGTDQNGSEDLETAVAALQAATGSNGGPFWVDADDTVVGTFSDTIGARYVDEGGYAWLVSLADGMPRPGALVSLYYQSGDCSGTGYVKFPDGPYLAGANIVFEAGGDPTYRSIPEQVTPAMLSLNSEKDSTGTCNGIGPISYSTIPAADTIPDPAISIPPTFALPLRVEIGAP